MPSMRQLLIASLQATSIVSSELSSRQADDVASFISKERPIALRGILDNIDSDGKYGQGASSGVVIASPSTRDPNYLYTWTRDSALVTKVLVDEFLLGKKNLEPYVKNYIKAAAVEQTVVSPSGNLQSGTGLGEPKFLINIKPFLGNWGRPQGDDPALRAITLIAYAQYLFIVNQTSAARDVVWPVIANDLAYVGQYWNQTGFDIGEEVSGSSFFTIQNQHCALVQGGVVARLLGVNFWNGNTVVANINTNAPRTGIDVNTLLGAISTFDLFGSCTDGTLQPCNSKILASHKVLVDSFRSIYGVNKGRIPGQAAAIGRYTEDVYYSGNPWYLTTLGTAEILYDAIAQWKFLKQFLVDSISLAVFKDIYPSVQAQTYKSGSPGSEFDKIVAAVQTYADGFVKVVQQYTPSDGSLSEHFQRDSGTPQSAIRLTWSYAAFVTMAQRRSGYYSQNWGAQLVKPPPSVCQGTSREGTYVPATAAGAPQPSGSCTSTVTFAVNASTYYGESIYLTGNTTDLGNWNLSNAYGFSASNYTSAQRLWFISLQLPPSTPLSYKYFRVEADGSYILETTNRTLSVPPCNQAGLTTNDGWGGRCSTAPNCT